MRLEDHKASYEKKVIRKDLNLIQDESENISKKVKNNENKNKNSQKRIRKLKKRKKSKK